MRDYGYSLGRFGISEERMREMKWICRQYDQYRERAARWVRGERDGLQDGGEWRGRKDPTASEAIWRLRGSYASARAAAIEQAAAAADPALCMYILNNVARGVRYEEMDVPCGRVQFYRARRRFFVELDARV